MARPRKGEEKDRPVHLGFRVSKETNQALRKLADERGAPMSDVAVEILESGLRVAMATRKAKTKKGKVA
jgi:hypothetical protein